MRKLGQVCELSVGKLGQVCELSVGKLGHVCEFDNSQIKNNWFICCFFVNCFPFHFSVLFFHVLTSESDPLVYLCAS